MLSLNLQAGSPVWRISQGDQQLYLGGTIHVLAPSDYPLPPGFAQAYGAAQTLVLETDLEAMQTPEFQAQLLRAVTYPPGETLRSKLSADTWRRLQAYLQERGVPEAMVGQMRPGMLTLTLTLLELQRLGMMGTGVDQYFAQQARRDGKALGELETLAQQLGFLRQLGAGEEDALVAYTLRDLDQLAEIMGALKQAWRTGDRQGLVRIALLPMRRQSPGVHEALLVARNRDWLPQLERLMATPEVELVLVGALHLVGEEGLLEQLVGQGYRVEQLD